MTIVLCGSELAFLNYIIIQSKYETHIYQSNHIQQKILNEYFGDMVPSTIIPFQSSSFPFKNTFEMELFQALSLANKELEIYAYKFKGSYNHWTGSLMNVSVGSRIDISYTTTRLLGYSEYFKALYHKALHQFMQYFHHHHYMPLTYPRKQPNMLAEIKSHYTKVEAENKNLDNIRNYTGMIIYIDSDLSRYLSKLRSTSSIIHEYIEVVLFFR